MARQRMIYSGYALYLALVLGAGLTLPAPYARSAETAPGSTTATAPAPQGEKRVTNIWIDTDIRQAIQDIAAQTDTVIVCDQTVQGVISMSVKDMPLRDCLERVCAAGGYAILQVKDYFVVGKAEAGNPLFGQASPPVRVKLSNVLPDQVKSLLHSSLAPYVTYDKSGGTLVVTAPKLIRQQVLDAIALVDQPNPQVAIEAIVFELTEEGSKQLALDWQFNTPRISGGMQNLVGTITYGAASDLGTYVDLTLRAIIETQKGQVLANPRILVTNNTEAEIFVGQEKYFTLLSGQASNPYYTLQSIKAGVTLKVTPFIGKDGQITLNLEPEVSDVVSENNQMPGTNSQNNTNTPMPVVTRRHAKTVINIKDSQTVLLGGLLREQHRSTIDKVPIVGDIPGLGAAFRSVQNQKEQQEVVILITAHVVDGREAKTDKLTSRLTPRYVTPLDAIVASSKGAH